MLQCRRHFPCKRPMPPVRIGTETAEGSPTPPVGNTERVASFSLATARISPARLLTVARLRFLGVSIGRAHMRTAIAENFSEAAMFVFGTPEMRSAVLLWSPGSQGTSQRAWALTSRPEQPQQQRVHTPEDAADDRFRGLRNELHACKAISHGGAPYGSGGGIKSCECSDGRKRHIKNEIERLEM